MHVRSRVYVEKHDFVHSGHDRFKIRCQVIETSSLWDLAQLGVIGSGPLLELRTASNGLRSRVPTSRSGIDLFSPVGPRLIDRPIVGRLTQGVVGSTVTVSRIRCVRSHNF